MAKAISIGSAFHKSSIKRPGVHSKNKTSRLKSSKLYKKAYRGQGRV